MKKLYILATFLLPLIAIAQKENKIQIGVATNYHNRSCVGGMGFCSDSSNITESNKANAALQKVANNLVYLFFDINTLSNKELLQLKSENLFTVSGTKNMVLNSNILSKLNIDLQFSEIEVGSYPALIENEKVRGTLFLTKK